MMNSRYADHCYLLQKMLKCFILTCRRIYHEVLMYFICMLFFETWKRCDLSVNFLELGRDGAGPSQAPVPPGAVPRAWPSAQARPYRSFFGSCQPAKHGKIYGPCQPTARHPYSTTINSSHPTLQEFHSFIHITETEIYIYIHSISLSLKLQSQ
jgi:hypothetical protein